MNEFIMTSFAVFGASVSAQSRNHTTGAITGYSECLKVEHAAELGFETFHRICYPGNRLSDGGLLSLDALIAAKPDICLFEPSIEDMSRGVAATDDEYEYVYARMLEAGIRPLTLLLPNPAQRNPDLLPTNRRVRSLCAKFGLPTVAIDLSDVGALDGLFIGVHTTYEGARLIANRVAESLRGGAAEFNLASVQARLRPSSLIPVMLRRLNRLSGDGMRAFSFELTPHGPGPKRARLVQLHDIGPFSPVLEVTIRTTGSTAAPETRLLSVWDPYCHYTRRSFVSLFNHGIESNVPVSVSIRISDSDPDYAKCRRDDAKFSPASERSLKPIGAPHFILHGGVTASELRSEI